MTAADFELIVRALNEDARRYLVAGPLAVVAHGCMPLTDKFKLCLVVDARDEERVWRCLARIGHRRGGDNAVNVESLERVEFEEMYVRMELFELAAGIEIPACAYRDLVRLKRQSGRPKDLADLDQLEKARRVRPPYDPWYECTFEGNELWSLWHWADLSLPDKIRSLEESQRLGQMFRQARVTRGTAKIT